jgi:thiol-disulfide isomerase/thioredoxin
VKNLAFAIACIAALVVGFMLSQQFNTASDNDLVTAGQPALATPFTLNDVDGNPRSSSEWQGKTVVLNFWATWCPPCRREIPLLIDFAKQNPRFQIVGVALDDVDAVKAFSDEVGINYINLVGQADAIKVGMEHGNASGALPYTVVVSPDGKVTHRVIGELDEETLQAWVK